MTPCVGCLRCLRCLHLLLACTASPASLMLAPALQRVLDGQLLLMDAGCELNGYVSDVTRTWPVNGRFSSPQQAVYEGVLFAYRCAACFVPSKAALLPCKSRSAAERQHLTSADQSHAERQSNTEQQVAQSTVAHNSHGCQAGANVSTSAESCMCMVAAAGPRRRGT